MTRHHFGGVVGGLARVLLWGIERACLRRATRIHVLSDFSADLLWRLYGISSERIIKIPGGADLARFAPACDRNAVRRRLGLPERVPLLLTVRNLEPRMGLDILIDAMAILRAALPDALLLIGGAGSLRPKLESLVASRRLQGQVRLLGYIPEADLPGYYQAADVFVLPTRELEGFGLITAEALASGTPVLATAIGATPEILRPLDASLLLRDLTPAAMAERLQAFFAGHAEDRNTVEELRKASRRHAETKYNWDHVVGCLENTFADLTRPEPADTMPAVPCPACGSPLAKSRLLYVGAPYLRCPQCQTGRIARLPTQADLRNRYELEYPEAFPHAHVAAPRAEMFASILDGLAATGKGARLLDVGCGGGHLLAAASRRGWRPFGTDVSHAACGAAQVAGTIAIQADAATLPFRQASMDAICLVNVLDHTPDPCAALREAHRVLAPGGHMVIRVPNAAFHRPWVRLLTALGPLVRWREWDRYPILHLFPFSAKGLQRIVARAGFRVLDVRNSVLAAPRPGTGERGWQARVLQCVFWLIGAEARSLESLSRGRVLWGPSIELYAERPGVGVGE